MGRKCRNTGFTPLSCSFPPLSSCCQMSLICPFSGFCQLATGVCQAVCEGGDTDFTDPGQAESTKARVCFVIFAPLEGRSSREQPPGRTKSTCSFWRKNKKSTARVGHFYAADWPPGCNWGATEHYSNTKKARPMMPRT